MNVRLGVLVLWLCLLPSLQGEGEKDSRHQAMVAERLEKERRSTEATIQTARSVMAEFIAAEKDYHRTELDRRIRSALLARLYDTARDDYQKRRVELTRTAPEEAKRQSAVVTAYEELLKDLQMRAAVASVDVHAESDKVRITPEEAAQAQERMLEARRNLPQGKGELLRLARVMFEHLNRLQECNEAASLQTTEKLRVMKLKQDRVARLPRDLETPFFEKDERIFFEIELQRNKVFEAKLNEIRGTADIEGTDYAAERRKFDERLAQEAKITVTRPEGRWHLEFEW